MQLNRQSSLVAWWHRFSHKRKGFTLIEIVVVIAIIGILATLITIAIKPVMQKSRDAKRKSDINLAMTGLNLFKSDFKIYPNYTFYLGNTPASDTTNVDSSFQIGQDLASCNGNQVGAPNSFAKFASAVTNPTAGDFDTATLKPGLQSVDNFLVCLKYMDQVIVDPATGPSDATKSYQYRVSYDYSDVILGATLENPNDQDQKYLNSGVTVATLPGSTFTDTVKRYYIGGGVNTKQLDDELDKALNAAGAGNGSYVYQCTGNDSTGAAITKDSSSNSLNQPVQLNPSTGAWQLNSCTQFNVVASN